jgi:VWFA-related protein
MTRRGCVAIGMLVAWAATPTGQNQPPAFRLETEAVAVNVSVKRGNVPVQGLAAADFRLYDNDVPQDVAAISQDAIPVDVSIVTPTHAYGFQDHRELDLLRGAVSDMAAFLRPSDRYRVLVPGNAVVNAIPWRDSGPPDTSAIHLVAGQASLVSDAVLMALLHQTSPERRHLVVALSSGGDSCSLASGETLRRTAERSGGVLHWIDVQHEGSSSDRTAADPGGFRSVVIPGVRSYCRNAVRTYIDLRSVLADAVRLTGGTARAAWFADFVAVQAFEQILDDFRGSYVLHYVPRGVERTGWHRLRVETTASGYTVRARPGYWGPASTTAAPVR